MVNRKYINTDAAISSFIDIAVVTGWKNEEKKADILCIQTLCMITKILNKVSASGFACFYFLYESCFKWICWLEMSDSLFYRQWKEPPSRLFHLTINTILISARFWPTCDRFMSDVPCLSGWSSINQTLHAILYCSSEKNPTSRVIVMILMQIKC